MHANRFFSLLGIALGEALIGVNFSIVSTSLATIQKEFGASFLELQWMLNIFGIFLCSTLAITGRLADTYGRKKLFLIGLVGAGLASLISGAAQSPLWIIIAQGLQGIFGSSLLAVSQALMCGLFPENQKGHAIGIWAAIAGIVLGIGPLLSGVLITLAGWRWIFFMNIPVAILGVILVKVYIQESKSVQHRARIDFFEVGLLTLSIGSFVLGIMQGPHWGWTSFPSLICLCVFLIALPLFIAKEKKSPFPIIHPEFFLRRNFLLPSLSNFCLISFVWSAFFFFPLFFQTVQHYSPLSTGTLMLLATFPLVLFSHSVGRAIHIIGPKTLMLIGCPFLILSVLLQFFFTPTTPLYLGALACLSFGLGWLFIWGPSTTAAISSLPSDLAGIASGAFTTVQEVGATLGLTLTGTLFRASAAPFMDGYKHALWALLLLILIGFVSTLSIKRTQLQ